jgi:hypothetical protein
VIYRRKHATEGPHRLQVHSDGAHPGTDGEYGFRAGRFIQRGGDVFGVDRPPLADAIEPAVGPSAKTADFGAQPRTETTMKEVEGKQKTSGIAEFSRVFRDK